MFGRIAGGLDTPQPQTEFQRGLGRFSVLLLEVALALTTLIFIANMLLQRSVLESLMFSLAIAVGITPQLLPAVVSAEPGYRLLEPLAKKKVLVKRLVCIEDLGDMDILVTDKTGTLTEGRSQLHRRPARELDQHLRRGYSSSDCSRRRADYAGPTRCGDRPEPPRRRAMDCTAGRWGSKPGGYTATRPWCRSINERRMTSALVNSPEGDRLAS